MKSTTNRFGFTVTVGSIVNAHVSWGVIAGTVKSIDTKSNFAKAYGTQVKVGPYTVTADDCFQPKN